MTDMEWIIERDNNVTLAFDGVQIANVTSETPDSNRWTEIRIYSTADKYVCEVVGGTRVEGEMFRRQATVHDTPESLRNSLKRRNHQGEVYLTYLALDALEDAAGSCPTFRTALVERV